MKRYLVYLFLLISSFSANAQTEVGPEGYKVLWIIFVLVFIAGILFFLRRVNWKKSNKKGSPFIKKRKLQIELTKDRLYYPDTLTLKVRNIGNTAVDLTQPLLVFSNLWLKRKFRLKGMEGLQLYPLYLEAGKLHKLEVDLNRFYKHDKSLRRYPKSKIIIYDVKGKRFGSKSLFLRKTLFKW